MLDPTGLELTEDVDASDLFLHHDRIDLAHVTPCITFLHRPNLQLPYPVLIVVDVEATVMCYDAMVQC